MKQLRLVKCTEHHRLVIHTKEASNINFIWSKAANQWPVIMWIYISEIFKYNLNKKKLHSSSKRNKGITKSTGSVSSQPYRVCCFGDLQQLLFGSPLSVLCLSQILFQVICLLQPENKCFVSSRLIKATVSLTYSRYSVFFIILDTGPNVTEC